MKGTFETLINDNRPVIVDFHAIWCGPCKTQSPILKQIADEFGEKIRIIKIDVDANQQVALKYNIRSVPTLMIFKSGQIRHSQAGVHSREQLKSLILGLI